jgi:acetyl-CoA synthetase
VYGPLANGATVLMYEGAPDWPDRGRFWDLVEKYGVTILYTAPTAIRAFMRWGTDWPAKYDLSSLRLLGTVGEPINPEAWMWYHEHIGGGRCPIVDTWWQTETGGIMITPLPGVTETKPGSATVPFPGITRGRADGGGRHGGRGLPGDHEAVAGHAAHIWGDDERFRQNYWSRWDGIYFPGDGAKRDDDGYFWILGRVDDVLNVAGHRIGTMEVESALVDHPSVAEAAVVGRADELKGQAIAAFVTVKDGQGQRPAEAGPARARGGQDRRHRPAGRHPVHGGPAEDAVGQDHAAAAARHRRGPRARRHDDAGGSRRRREAEAEYEEKGGLRRRM